MNLSKKQAEEVSVIKTQQLAVSSLRSCSSPVARQHLDRQVSIELYEKQNSSSFLTLIRDYVFRLSFLTTLDI